MKKIKVLIANPFGIGDVVFTLASAEKIREVHPEAFIGFVCNERTKDLLVLCPGVDCLHVFNRDELRALLKKSPLRFLKRLWKMIKGVRNEEYDLFIDFSLGREFAFAAMLAGIRDRAGLDYKNRGVFLTRKKTISAYKGLPVAQRQLEFLKEAGVLPDDRMPQKIRFRVPEMELGIDATAGILAVAPGGGKSWGRDAVYKQWEPEKFAEVCDRVAAMRPGIKIVLLGDGEELELLERVKALLHTSGAEIWAGLPLARVCALLKKSELLVCNDGGLLHMANALGVKTVSIFGPVDERVYGPYGGTAVRRVVTIPVPCRPCYADFHFPPCRHSRECLAAIPVDKVIEPIREIL